MNHRYPYPSFTATHQCLIVLAQPSPPTQPSQCPFHCPFSKQHRELAPAFDLRIHHLPRSISTRGIDRSAYSSATWRHLCLGCRQDAPQLPAAFSSYPRLCAAFVRTPSCRRHSHQAPFFVVFTAWLSLTATVGIASLPALLRTFGRNSSCTRSQVPSSEKRLKYLYTVCHGGRLCGNIRQEHPVRSTYRMSLSTSLKSTVRGLPSGLDMACVSYIHVRTNLLPLETHY